jgi:hypothetical protein
MKLNSAREKLSSPPTAVVWCGKQSVAYDDTTTVDIIVANKNRPQEKATAMVFHWPLRVYPNIIMPAAIDRLAMYSTQRRASG